VRYYLIRIFQKGSTTVLREYTSFPNGQNDPGALNVVLDLYIYAFGDPQQQAVVQIWGVPIADLAQAANFTDCTIQVYAGFQKGLPLNNPAQAGLVLAGSIFQSYGNWTGVDMTLDLVVVTQGAVSSNNSNVSFSWMAGTTLSDAITTTLKNAFPTAKLNINISPKLVIAHDEHGVYQALPAFAQMLKPLTAAAIGGTYPGVDIVWTPNEIRVFDGSTQANPVQIAFQDLVGQPVWIQQSTIQFMTPMRADLSVGDFIAMPKGILGSTANPAGVGSVTTTAASQPQARQQSIFSGTFGINLVHHMGIFRQPDGTAWVSVFNATAQIVPQGTVTIDSLSFSP
jgi:hypothetical protein